MLGRSREQGFADTVEQSRVAEEHESPQLHAVLAPAGQGVVRDPSYRAYSGAKDDSLPALGMLGDPKESMEPFARLRRGTQVEAVLITGVRILHHMESRVAPL
jgi:hypothetical protein